MKEKINDNIDTIQRSLLECKKNRRMNEEKAIDNYDILLLLHKTRIYTF